ncbi:GNAT family N-acetyltransferase [Oceanibacterium hippocampi]|uniref:Putative N-acetyltransferase YycN n=1 Tax=Oceanibacterium hippocampi TaxID=745714 RepID=A0A1Y5SD11_9PROT|nr:GNAT family N-acetyltransferase [Oceanibacterium hippocampi]SLN37977.1 putative N-acetyltransferase YycN [Oceanibacterium hippocampi]
MTIPDSARPAAEAPIHVRDSGPDDLDAVLAILPRLAAFELPPKRVAEDLWRHDAALLRAKVAGERPDCHVRVAEGEDGALLGVAILTLRPEPMSGAPSAHLEVLAVAEGAEGRGVGRALMEATEAVAAGHGARSVTLHVFANNDRARRLYERVGYASEIHRYIKHLDD